MLTIVDYSIEELEAMGNPKNPRWMPEQQMEALQSSLKQFGLVEPLIVNTTTKRIVGGHQRVQAGKANGDAALPAVVVELSEAEEIALNLSLNKIRGFWDYEKLSQILEEIPAESLLATGFTETDVEAIVRVAPAEIFEGEEGGIVEDLRNQTEEEVEDWLEKRNKVQFGMFNKAIPLDQYEAWLKQLEVESEHGASPLSLGMVVAKRLGIDVIASEEEEETTEAVAEEEEYEDYSEESEESEESVASQEPATSIA